MTTREGMYAVVLVGVVGCGSSSGSNPPSLYNLWIESSSASQGQTVEFKNDGTYGHANLSLVTSNSANAEVETGTFALAGDGKTMTLTPQQWSCTGSYAPYTATYSFAGNDLIFTVPGHVFDMQIDTAGPEQSSLTEGCFTSSGFIPQALAPVTP